MPKETEFKDLTEEQCSLIVAILQMQSRRPPVSATSKKITESTGLQKQKIDRLLFELRKISKSRYVVTVKGKRPVRYRVPTFFLITQSATAHILLLLNDKCPRNKDGVFVFEKAVKWLGRQTGLPQNVICDRIRKSIRQKYLLEIVCDKGECFEIGLRIGCEEILLRKLAERKFPAIAQGVSPG